MQAAESVKMETTAGVHSKRVLFAQQQTIFQHTQNPHSHAQTREQCGPQGTPATATTKSAAWTTTWPTTVPPRPAQTQPPLHQLNQLKHQTKATATIP